MKENQETVNKKVQTTDSFISLTIGLAIVLLVGAFIYNYISNRKQAQQTTEQITQQAEQPTNNQGQVVAPGGTYTVALGDTLWKIAEKHYKSGYNWTDIQNANNLVSADKIEVGQTLTIPEVTPKRATDGQIASASMEVSQKPSQYTVVAGDTLWKIAVSQYGSGYRWVDIAKTNNLANPNVIHSGNTLTLPQ